MLNFEHNLCLLAKISYILSSIAIYTCHMYFVFQFFISRIFSLYHIFYFSESSFFSYLDPWMSEKSQSHFPTFFFFFSYQVNSIQPVHIKYLPCQGISTRK